MEYSIKTKNADGSSSISMGNIYYDKFIDQLIYANKYPDISTWIIKDTIIYQIKNRLVIDKQRKYCIMGITKMLNCAKAKKTGKNNTIGITNSVVFTKINLFIVLHIFLPLIPVRHFALVQENLF